jgi:hypothetical protein
MSDTGKALDKAAGDTITAQPNTFDIRDYKCVPLDLLKNIGKDGEGNNIITVTSEDKSLKDFKQQQQSEVTATGPGASSISADAMENFIVGIVSFFFILTFLVIFYYGFLNFRAEGLAAFRLPTQLRSMPVILSVSLLFAILGFVVGFLVKS